MTSKGKKSVLMNSVVCTPTESKQPNILSMFAAAKSTAEEVPAKKTLTKSAKPTLVTESAPVEKPADLTSEDPLVAAFYKSLSPAEATAHRIATIKLGTSYDVTRTRGFLAWSKTRGTTSATT